MRRLKRFIPIRLRIWGIRLNNWWHGLYYPQGRCGYDWRLSSRRQVANTIAEKLDVELWHIANVTAEYLDNQHRLGLEVKLPFTRIRVNLPDMGEYIVSDLDGNLLEHGKLQDQVTQIQHVFSDQYRPPEEFSSGWMIDQ